MKFGPKDMKDLVSQIMAVVEQRDNLLNLCGEVLMTLNLPANQDKVLLLGPNFQYLLKRWTESFKKLEEIREN